MQDIIAVNTISYGGKKYNPGDKIPARSRDAKVLMALGKAKPCGPIVNVPAKAPAKKADIVQPPPTPPPAPIEPQAQVEAQAQSQAPDAPPPEAPAETPPTI